MSKIAELNRLLSYMAYRVFKPVVILFLRNSVPFQTASDWLKRIYVDVALGNKEFRINPDKKQTKTRVAVLTGLSRVEIDRVLKIEKPLEVTEQKWNRAIKVLSGWTSNDKYLDKSSLPLSLPIVGDVSFTTLVEEYSGGATMRSVLDELVHVKSVVLNSNKVKILRNDYAIIPSEQKLLNLEISGMSTGDLLNTLVFNDKIEDANQKRFQKLVAGLHIPKNEVEDAKQFIYKETNKLLVSIDKKLTPLASETSSNTYTIGLGAYYFEEKTNEEK